MHRRLLLLIGLFTVFYCQAQVTMTLQMPPTGVLLKKQLWNMSLVYTGSLPIRVKITLTLSDLSTDEPLLTASTGLITLNKGAKVLQAADFTPIQYQFLSSAIGDRDPDGYLAAGNYQACYIVVQANEAQSALTEDCTSFEVAALSPPILNIPADESVVQTFTPQFSWLPPTPLNLFPNLSYRFNLVQVMPGQNPLDAVQQNVPVYANYNCADLFINYPAAGMALDTGKVYAWQVIAQNNLKPSEHSEVWTFKLTSPAIKISSTNSAYITLKKNFQQEGIYSVDNGNLSIRLYSFDKPHVAELRFKSSERQIIKTVKQNINYGDNFLNYPLDNTFKKGQLYIVEITSLNNTIYTASFRLK